MSTQGIFSRDAKYDSGFSPSRSNRLYQAEYTAQIHDEYTVQVDFKKG
jgi:hypothetical protein